MKKLSVYSIGQHGINRVKSPVHVLDGELLSAQNASVRPVQGQLALTKRDGMTKVNAAVGGGDGGSGGVAAGGLFAIINIPFTDPGWTPLGNNWILGTSTGTNVALNDVAWSPTLEIFVAVGNNHASGSSLTSTDGLTWTQRVINGSNIDWENVIWAPTLDKFLAAGDPAGSDSQFAYSDDGITWTTPTALEFTSTRAYCVGYSPDLDIAVLLPSDVGANRFFYTTDLSTFAFENQSFTKIWSEVAWSPLLGMFAAVSVTAGTDQVCTSTNGINWTLVTSNVNSTWRDIVWSETHRLFVAVASAGTNRVMTSPDGTTWTGHDVGTLNDWQSLTELNGRFIAVASSTFPTQVMVSDDGITWTTQTDAANQDWTGVAISQSLRKAVAVSSNGSIRSMYSV